MSTAADIDTKMPLGVGSIVGDSLSLLFKHLIPVTLMALLPNAVALLAMGSVIGIGVVIGTEVPDVSNSNIFTAMIAVFVLQIVFYSLTTALLVQLAYDAKLGRPIQIGRYFGPAIRSIVPIAVLSVIVALLATAAMIALIIPGLWVYAVFAVVTPAIVIERAGFGGLGRSADLTKNYRWPVLGALILVGICTFIFNFVSTFLAGIVAEAGAIVAAIAYLVPTALAAGLISICVALIYARLREIKEGVSVDQIASVFD
ncbi:hypothetical protein [Leisingera sp. ANG-Vp]|uniref:hypothetical protein n=1 Tax=Leisingera sp. ANG-Vp TaxID=1577896 RepID=UPI00057FB726|nr:hypothetical protein [Leisingera sp. ANG-Vp]KIC18923.1 membrane protein [Leisingera sp. ANG-Vp]